MATAFTEVERNKRRTVLLISFFVLFIILIGYIFSLALNTFWIFPVAIVVALSQAIFAVYYSDKVVLAISRAVPADKEKDRLLLHLVDTLSIQSGLPRPAVYVIEDSAPNAFATGRDPQRASICVTRGLLDKLGRNELEGVLAHEFSHIGNFDIRLQTVIVILVGIVVLVSDWFIRISFFSRDDNRDSQFGGILMIIGIILALLSPLFATLIQLAISRKREFLADADSVVLTHDADALANALEKITKDPESLESANKATAHLYIMNPLKNDGGAKSWFSGLFDTHPDPAERIKRLREMAR